MKRDKKKLIEEAEFLQKNIDWWVEEVSKACEDIDEIDLAPDIPEKEIKKRFERLEYLVGKADLEIKHINDLETKSIEYFKKLYEENKPPNARLVKRKKRKLP